ncbi:hypothetical protein ACHAQJ_009828, partial [Trichoderma viride]
MKKRASEPQKLRRVERASVVKRSLEKGALERLRWFLSESFGGEKLQTRENLKKTPRTVSDTRHLLQRLVALE